MATTFMHKSFGALVLCAVLTACIEPASQPEQPCGCSSQSHLISATLYTQRASEYKALCLQAYAVAMRELPSVQESALEAAVVLDLDETVLDNSPYTAWQIENDKPYSPESWTQWVDLAKAEAVPGAINFLNFADSLGLKLFYISNRDTSHLEATMKNMKALGIPQVQQEHFMLKTTTSDKSERRRAVEELGHEIVMLIGDNLGDFHGAYDKPATNSERDNRLPQDAPVLGRKYILLPNALYGTWEGAMYGYDRSLNEKERCEIRMNQLQGIPELN